MRIEGTNKTFGVHAAGVVIAANSLDNLVPLQGYQIKNEYYVHLMMKHIFEVMKS